MLIQLLEIHVANVSVYQRVSQIAVRRSSVLAPLRAGVWVCRRGKFRALCRRTQGGISGRMIFSFPNVFFFLKSFSARGSDSSLTLLVPCVVLLFLALFFCKFLTAKIWISNPKITTCPFTALNHLVNLQIVPQLLVSHFARLNSRPNLYPGIKA